MCAGDDAGRGLGGSPGGPPPAARLCLFPASGDRPAGAASHGLGLTLRSASCSPLTCACALDASVCRAGSSKGGQAEQWVRRSTAALRYASRRQQADARRRAVSSCLQPPAERRTGQPLGAAQPPEQQRARGRRRDAASGARRAAAGCCRRCRSGRAQRRGSPAWGAAHWRRCLMSRCWHCGRAPAGPSHAAAAGWARQALRQQRRCGPAGTARGYGRSRH